jgi:hypothetical protein
MGTRAIARALPALSAQIAALDFRRGAVALPGLLRQQPPWLNALNRRLRWDDLAIGEVCAAGSTATVRKAELRGGSEIDVAVKIYKHADEQALYSFVSELFAYLLLSSSSESSPFVRCLPNKRCHSNDSACVGSGGKGIGADTLISRLPLTHPRMQVYR